jgi:hypothetical protein
VTENPFCEKHGYHGHDCLFCRLEKIADYEKLRLVSIQMAYKLETLLLAIEITETKMLLPNTFIEAKKILEEYKKLDTDKDLLK